MFVCRVGEYFIWPVSWKLVVLQDKDGFCLKIPLGTEVLSTEISQFGPVLVCAVSSRGIPLSTQLSL